MKKAYMYAGVSIFCWSTVATTCKILLGELNNFQLLWMNAVIAGLFLLIVNLCNGNFKKYKEYKIKDYLSMIAIGVPGTFFYYVFYYAGTDMMPASQAFIVNYLWPIMSVLLAAIVLKERFTPRMIIAIIVSFAGVVVVMGGAIKSFDSKMLLGALCCIGGAVSYGVFTSLNQKFKYNKLMTLMISYFATFIITSIINCINKDLFMPRVDQMAGFMWNGIFAVALANVCWVLALEKGSTSRISNLAYITPFLSTVWTRIFLGEEITVNAVTGLVVIVLGIFIQLTDNKNKSQKAESKMVKSKNI